MKLMSTPMDAHPTVDARSNNTPRQAADTSSNDNNSPPFDGVLADVGSDAKAAQASDGSTKKSDATTTGLTLTGLAAELAKSELAKSGLAKSGSAKTETAKTGLVTTGTTTAGAASTTIIASFIGTLGASLTTNAGAAATQAGTTGDKAAATADPNDLVDSLLKRIASKDAPSGADANAAAAVPSAIPTDMMAMLLQSSGAKAPAPAAAADPGKTAPSSATATIGATAASGTTSVASDAKETVVSDVSVSTHLAPATPVQGKASPTEDAKSVAKVGTIAPEGTTAPAPKSTGTDDTTVTLRHNSEPAATTLGISTVGGDFGPVRSIATAIGTLAAASAPAVTIPDPQTPTLGVARTMTLQMNPADLGTVGVRLHITGQTLDVQLTISNQETLGMVSRERDTLTSALHDQNYTLNSLVIQDGGAAASSGGNNAATQGNTPGGGYARPDRQGSDAAGSDTQNGGGRQGQGGNQSSQDNRRSSSDTAARSAAVESRGGLFV